MDPSCLLQKCSLLLQDGDWLCTGILFPEDALKLQRLETGEDKGGKAPARDPPVIQVFLIREGPAEVFQGDGTPSAEQGVENSSQVLAQELPDLQRGEPGKGQKNGDPEVFEYLDRSSLFPASLCHWSWQVNTIELGTDFHRAAYQDLHLVREDYREFPGTPFNEGY